MLEKNNFAWQVYRPGKEPYFAAKVIETFPYFAGKRGEFAVGLFAYLRWVDNIADERNDLTKSQKLNFIERQREVVAGSLCKGLLPMETIFNQLPWKNIPEREIRPRINIILGSIANDVVHQGFEVRTERQIKHYNWRTIMPVVDILFLVLNGKIPRVNFSMMQLLDAYIRIGSLQGIGDDLRQEVVKLPIQANKDGKTSVVEVLGEYDEDKFNRTKQENLKRILLNADSFLRLDIPIWQKLVCLVYIGDVLLMKNLRVKRKTAVGALEKELQI